MFTSLTSERSNVPCELSFKILLRPGKLIYGRERSTALIRLDYQPLLGDMSLRPFPEPIVSSGRSED